jgi:hypothetical protein
VYTTEEDHHKALMIAFTEHRMLHAEAEKVVTERGRYATCVVELLRGAPTFRVIRRISIIGTVRVIRISIIRISIIGGV